MLAQDATPARHPWPSARQEKKMPLNYNRRNPLFVPITAFWLFMAFPQVTGEKAPVFYFQDQPLKVGMAASDAVTSLAACCTLSPPVKKSEIDGSLPWSGSSDGHFITSKERISFHLRGVIYFAGGRVVRIERPLDEGIDGWNDDLVRFAKALDRALAPETGDSQSRVLLEVQHTRLSNGEGEYLSLVFPNGRGVRLNIATLDSPGFNGRQNSAGLDEFLTVAKK
jgi:hypothetical protein